jgi:preprotein translocase subunit SecA
VLSVLDRKWREHLYEMDYLREGIGLRAMAQRDPLIEYQREGFDMFSTMMEGIKEESVGSLFNLQVEYQENPIVEEAVGEMPAVPFPLGQVLDGGTPAGPGGPGGGPRDRGPGGAGPGGAGPGGAGPGGGSAPADGAQAPRAGKPAVVAPGLSPPQRPSRLSYSAPTVDGEERVERRSENAAGGDFGKVGRNAPCPCGSGRKYKLCHGDPRNRSDG